MSKNIIQSIDVCINLLVKVTEYMKDIEKENAKNILDDKENDDVDVENDDVDVEKENKDKIYKIKSTNNDNVYTITYNTRNEYYTCTCPDYIYHCVKNNMMCKHIQKVKDIDDANLSMCDNGITILQ